MTPQNKLYEAAKALIGDLINKRSYFNSFQNLCGVLPEYEQSIEQPEAIAGENQSALGFIESEYGKTWTNPYFGWSTDDVVDAMSAYASQQTSAKDKQIEIQQAHIDDQDQLIFDQTKEIAELKEAISELEKLI